MNKLAPSMLSIDFGNIERDIRHCVNAKADYIHVDVMDGLFVPNISFGPPVIKYVKKAAENVPLDVHLMIEAPERYIDEFKKAGADILTIHYESTKDVRKTVELIKAAGMKAGVAIKPKTPVSVLRELLPELDMALIMSVEPGFGGQSFIPESFDKIRELRAMIEEINPLCDLEVDGGIKEDNLKDVLDAGANVIVAGSAIFSNDIEANTEKFLKIMK
ncbi:MAG: ribulose-phosphate 3-epimerase [Eubacterium sp.]|nr:ribulose-phosphate 3-epimerase [Eubacterium sp.]MBR6218772.1 ribulose-phosphate 3-epimerase [Eubacterium sp.]